MLELPSRKELAAVIETANAVVPTVALGFVRSVSNGRALVLHSHPHGISQYSLAASDLPSVLSPQGNEIRHAGADAIRSNPQGAIEWQLIAGGVQAVFSLQIPGVNPATRLWLAFAQEGAPANEQLSRLQAIADTSASLLRKPDEESQQAAEHGRRLELAAALLPALLHVLDVRDVFERLSSISRAALPHDMLTLALFSDDLETMTMYARTGRGDDVGRVFPQPYPPAVTQAWDFDIIDDRAAYPLERDRPPTRLGMRSSLRLPFRFDDRVIGGLAFHARIPAQYSSADVAIGRRLADYVASALSHHRLAQRLADEARRNEELRARTSNLELLDELLAALIDSGELRDVFERISTIAAKVLPHDAVALLVRLPDGTHYRVYASRGFPPGAPATTEVPRERVENPDWEHDIVDDLSQMEPHDAGLVDMGFRSLLRVPIRLEGRFAGALVFLSRAPSTFKHGHIGVARRMADRMTVTLARDRVIEAAKRAYEATERASKLEARVRALTEELDVRTGYRRVVGESPQWRQVLTQAAQVSSTETTVLLLGASGTGKEVIARFLHRGSPRSNGPFIALNCAALPEQLLEAELFGYERGAFTGATQSKPGQLEQAAGGTLFLDEVGEMSPSAQAKFLRVLQEREFQRLGGTRVLRTDARIVAATNRDLPHAIAQGQFREDLYYRLNVFAIRLPALRDRKDDILPLSDAFLSEIGRGLGRPPGGITREARELLVHYHWPGNVRELRNILERAAILCDGGLITVEHLALTVTPAPAASLAPPTPVAGEAAAAATPTTLSSAGDLQTMERAMIEQALRTARFNKSKAAKALGLTRHQLYLRMQKYGFK